MQETFPYRVFLGFILGFFVLVSSPPSFLSVRREKKGLKKCPQGQRQSIFTIENLQTQEKKKYHRETNRGSRSKTSPSQPRPTTVTAGARVPAPLTRLGASLTTSPLSTAACAREATELRKASCRLPAKRREGIRASGSYTEGKYNLNRDAFFTAFPIKQRRAEDGFLSNQRKIRCCPLKSSERPGQRSHLTPPLLLPGCHADKKGEHTLFKFTSWMPFTRTGQQITVDVHID